MSSEHRQHSTSVLDDNGKEYEPEGLDISPTSILPNADHGGSFTEQASAPSASSQQSVDRERNEGMEEQRDSIRKAAPYGLVGVIGGIFLGPWIFLFLCCQDWAGLKGARKKSFMICAILGIAFQMAWLGIRVAFGLPPFPWPIAYFF